MLFNFSITTTTTTAAAVIASPARSRTLLSSVTFRRAVFLSAFILLITAVAPAQAQKQQQRGGSATSATAAAATPAPGGALLTRSTTRREVRRFGYGGTLTIYGAPAGAITIEAWTRNEVEIEADIELKAHTEEELARLAVVNNFVLDEDLVHLTLLTTGTHDRKFMKRTDKNFPKQLLGLPWKIDYRIRVPAAIDLEVFAGSGALTIKNTEGALGLTGGETRAELVLGGGDVVSNLTGGTLVLRVPERNWRGRGATIRLVRGDLTLELPPNFNADIDATVLRAGRIAANYPGL